MRSIQTLLLVYFINIMNGIYSTTIILRPLYKSTCISWHLQLRTGGFCWCRVLLPHALTDGNQCIWISEKMLELSAVLSILSPYLAFTEMKNSCMLYGMFFSGCRCGVCCNFEWHSRLPHVLCISWPQHRNWGYSWCVCTFFLWCSVIACLMKKQCALKSV